jgi:hypothetical protein
MLRASGESWTPFDFKINPFYAKPLKIEGRKYIHGASFSATM